MKFSTVLSVSTVLLLDMIGSPFYYCFVHYY